MLVLVIVGASLITLVNIVYLSIPDVLVELFVPLGSEAKYCVGKQRHSKGELDRKAWTVHVGGFIHRHNIPRL